MKTIRLLLLAAVALVVTAFVIPSSSVQAADLPISGHPASVVLPSVVPSCGIPVLAQITPPATVSSSTVATPAPWYADGAFVGGLFTALVTIFGIWSHKEKSKAQRISESLVVGIEAATKIPAVAAAEKEIKAKIKQTAKDYGVQPLLDRIVNDVT